MSDAMPKEQKEFIGDIASYVDTTTNYGTERATQFAFEIWQNRRFLTEFLGKQIRTDAIDLVEQLKNKYESFTHEEYYVSAMVSDLEDLLEQLKEQTNDR